jgi:hypothetical protein
MRILVSALVLALCVFALPALADSPEEICPAAPDASVSGLTGAPEPILLVPPLNTYCWDVDGTYCRPVGSTKGCTDGIYYDYVCTCRYNSYTRTNYWDCPEVR